MQRREETYFQIEGQKQIETQNISSPCCSFGRKEKSYIMGRVKVLSAEEKSSRGLFPAFSVSAAEANAEKRKTQMGFQYSKARSREKRRTWYFEVVILRQKRASMWWMRRRLWEPRNRANMVLLSVFLRSSAEKVQRRWIFLIFEGQRQKRK